MATAKRKRLSLSEKFKAISDVESGTQHGCVVFKNMEDEKKIFFGPIFNMFGFRTLVISNKLSPPLGSAI